MQAGTLSKRFWRWIVLWPALSALALSACADTSATPAGIAAADGHVQLEHALMKYFGTRSIRQDGERIKIMAPYVMQRHARTTPVTVRIAVADDQTAAVKRILVISDDGRRLMTERFVFPSQTDAVTVSMNLALSDSADLHAVLELTDGSLWLARQRVKLTVGGYGL